MPLSEAELNQLQVITQALDIHAQRNPQDAALYYINDQDEREQLTYGDLQSQAQFLAQLLLKNTNPGDRILLIFPPGLEFVVAFFACAYAGRISVPSYPPANQALIEKLQSIIDDAKPSVIVTSNEIHKKLKKLSIIKKIARFLPINKLLFYILGKHAEQLNWDVEKLRLISHSPNKINNIHHLPFPTSDTSSIVFLQYTSGSTGQPKGVINTHANLLHNIQLIIKAYGIHPDSIGVSWLPPYHDMGLIGHIILPVVFGVPCTLISPINFLKNPYSWLSQISLLRADVSGGPNFAFEYCTRKVTELQKKSLDLSCWRVAINGAEPIHHETIERFYQAFKSCGFKKENFVPSYGLAEATLMVSAKRVTGDLKTLVLSRSDLSLNKVTLANNDSSSVQLFSLGKSDLEVKILNLHTKQLANDNEIGEILVAGTSVTSGYWQNSKLNKKLFYTYQTKESEQLDFLRTGDLGFLHQGEIYVTGRIKQLIIIRGKNFYPHDIEHKVCLAHPLIKAGCCTAFSITEDNEEKLVILTEVQRIPNEQENEEICIKIRQLISQTFAISPHVVGLLPARATLKTTSGKLRRNDMKNAYLHQKLTIFYEQKTDLKDNLDNETSQAKNLIESNNNDEEKKNSNDTKLRIKEWLLERISNKTSLPISKISLDQPLVELGIDSLDYVGLFAEIESVFNCNIDMHLMGTYPSINSILKIMAINSLETSINIANVNPYSDELGSYGFMIKRKKVGIILVHGYSGSPGEMSPLAFELAKAGISVAVPQLAGHCSSYRDLKNTKWQNWYASVKKASDLLSRHCDIIFVAGLSAGSHLALNLALELDTKIAGVILLSPVFFYDGWNVSTWQNLFNGLMINSFCRYFYKINEKPPYGIKNKQAQLALSSLLANGLDKNIAKTGNMVVPALGLYEVNKLIKHIQKQIAKISNPTLIIHSLEDDIASFKNAEYAKKHLGSQLIEIVSLKDSYHVITLDNEKDYVALKVINFITQALSTKNEIIS